MGPITDLPKKGWLPTLFIRWDGQIAITSFSWKPLLECLYNLVSLRGARNVEFTAPFVLSAGLLIAVDHHFGLAVLSALLVHVGILVDHRCPGALAQNSFIELFAEEASLFVFKINRQVVYIGCQKNLPVVVQL